MDLSGLVGPYGTVASGLDTWAGRWPANTDSGAPTGRSAPIYGS